MLSWTFGDSLNPALSSISYNRLLGAVSTQGFNLSKDGETLTYLANLLLVWLVVHCIIIGDTEVNLLGLL